MTPEKCRKAMVRGLHKLSPRIQKLRAQLQRLEKAELWLVNEKWTAEADMIEVQYIPIGISTKKAAHNVLTSEQKINNMSAEEANELLSMLERRLNHGSVDA